MLLVAVVALLFLVVFPWASPKLPFNHVTVDTPTPAPTHFSSPAAHPLTAPIACSRLCSTA